jgi:hypothetical protein
VGMVGLYAGGPSPCVGRVIEYGDARARYVLTEEESPAVETVEDRAGGRIARRLPPGRLAAPRRHRRFLGVGGRSA